MYPLRKHTAWANNLAVLGCKVTKQLLGGTGSTSATVSATVGAGAKRRIIQLILDYNRIKALPQLLLCEM